MKTIYLIRHTTPAIQKGLCYGQSDIEITESFEEEASLTAAYIPQDIDMVYSSPLSRCYKLSERLFHSATIHKEDDLREINCGDWEMLAWDSIAPGEIDPWLSDFIQRPMPNGESYLQLYQRVASSFAKIVLQEGDAAIVTHGGVIRSILTYITKTEVRESFKNFSSHYGCVIRIDADGSQFSWKTLYNPAPVEKEQHAPSRFSKR